MYGDKAKAEHISKEDMRKWGYYGGSSIGVLSKGYNAPRENKEGGDSIY